MVRFFIACILLFCLPVISQAQSTPNSSSAKFQWKRVPQNPIIPAATGSLMESMAGGPDVLLNGNTYYLYFHGQAGGHARIGAATVPRSKFDGVTWDLTVGRLIEMGGPGSWDETACLDPATVMVKDRVFLYYTGVSSRPDRAICLAVSNDGIHFTKYEKNPVTIGSTPEVVYYKNTFYLYFQRPVPGKESFQIYYATSQDGFHFTDPSLAPALPVGPEGSWDRFSVETPRIFSEGNLFYMVYCGSDRYKDSPWNAGLATSRDLVHWTKYAGNPIYSRGYPGTFDEGSICSPTVVKNNDRYYMFYQGFGGGKNRNEPYGSDLQGGRAQVGAATLDAPYFFVRPDKKK